MIDKIGNFYQILRQLSVSGRRNGVLAAIDDFFDLLWATPQGKVCICNLLDCEKMHLVDKSLIKTFVAHWLSAYNLTPIHGGPLAILDSVVTTKSTLDYDYLWKANRSPNLNSDYIATTLNSKYLKGQLDSVSTRTFDSLFRLVSRHDASMPIRDLERLENEIFLLVKNTFANGDPKGLIEVTFDKPIGGPKPRIWFTGFGAGDIEDQVWQAESNWHQRADIARERLGLIHFGSRTGRLGAIEPTLLATVVVAAKSIPSGTKLARPTFMDAGQHSRFKGAFGDLRKKPHAWGRAVDLARILLSRPHRGGREVVLENFRPDGPTWISVLGFTRVPRGDYLSVHETEFASSVLRSRGEAQIRERFLRICQ